MSVLKLGKVVMTQGVNAAIEEKSLTKQELLLTLFRHRQGDWGDLCKEDKYSNEYALLHNERIVSTYTVGKGQIKILIITEHDRSVTTILLPEEY